MPSWISYGLIQVLSHKKRGNKIQKKGNTPQESNNFQNLINLHTIHFQGQSNESDNTSSPRDSPSQTQQQQQQQQQQQAAAQQAAQALGQQQIITLANIQNLQNLIPLQQQAPQQDVKPQFSSPQLLQVQGIPGQFIQVGVNK